MDTVTLTTADGLNLFALLATVLWHAIRIGAAMQVLPAIGGKGIPPRARMIFTLALSAALSATLPAPPAAAVDAITALNVLREFAIGLSIGLILKLAFEAGILAGQFASQGMALSFATMADPANNTQIPVLSQWFYLVFGLVFFTLDAHVALIQLLLDSYRTQPIGAPLADMQAFLASVPGFFPTVLRTAVLMSLPVTIAMLAINMVVGVLSRAAPQFNPIQIGMPIALLAGLALLVVLARELLGPVQALFGQAFEAARAVTG
ncbi:flagellar biosynthetic protein FliR [Thermomonas paludicola]|uniref:flagellar biosynthetic protein FliR n=1 Tax=Thermomonas paludicola TaxID=2884874 RepID=UPI0021148CFC|nr:flagellar biosynthetic protein FliR [Thermomonas paludicola]